MKNFLFFIYLMFTAECIVAQTNSKLTIYYNTGQFNLNTSQQSSIDSFLQPAKNNSSLNINGYTDDKGNEVFNDKLSSERANAVEKYIRKNFTQLTTIAPDHFGKNNPVAENSSDENRALNRRVEIIITEHEIINATGGPMNNSPPKKAAENLKVELNNGVIITYKKGVMPVAAENTFTWGGGVSLIENTSQMQANNILAMTTSGGVLSSVCMFCFGQTINKEPCKTDTFFKIQIPIHNPMLCPVNKIKFFNSVVQDGYQTWTENNSRIYPEIINGQQYITVWINDLCVCYNFDYQIEPECFSPIKINLVFKKIIVKKIFAIIDSVNTVYIPSKISEDVYQLILTDSTNTKLFLDLELIDKKGKVQKLKRVPLEKIKLNGKKYIYQVNKRALKQYGELFKVQEG